MGDVDKEEGFGDGDRDGEVIAWICALPKPFGDGGKPLRLLLGKSCSTPTFAGPGREGRLGKGTEDTASFLCFLRKSLFSLPQHPGAMMAEG